MDILAMAMARINFLPIWMPDQAGLCHNYKMDFDDLNNLGATLNIALLTHSQSLPFPDKSAKGREALQ
jgi:hypothetical protein